MICKKCNTDNNTSAKYCKSCGIALESTNTPLRGGERINIIIYFLLLLATSFPIGSGAIPLIVSLITLYIIKTNKNFDSVGASYMIAVIACILAAAGWFFAASQSRDYFQENLFSAFSVGSLILIPLLNSLFFSILEKHQQWIIENGLFADTPKELKKQSSIIGRDNLSTFSIADEMLKWNELLEKELITKEEFAEAKQKLLQQ